MSKTSDNLDTSGERGRGGWTPGPWVCSPQNNNPFCAWDVKAPNEVNGYICTTSGNAKANARLIAAAPEMIELLQEILSCACSRDAGNYREIQVPYVLTESIVKAIKKATGE